MRIAITRKVSPRIGDCELTHLARVPINVTAAAQQHLAYEQALEALGCTVVSLPAEAALPDSVFVEDAAVVFDELAVITRPGAESRRKETESIAAALRPYRELRFLEAPATLDGGDVLRLGRRVLVGLSTRTNETALRQIRALPAPFGYEVEGVRVNECLHLKSAVTEVAEGVVLLNPAWVDAALFAGMSVIEVAPAEPNAANALRIGEAVVYPAAFPSTLRRLQDHGIAVTAVDIAELSKAEGAVTCCSLLVASSF